MSDQEKMNTALAMFGGGKVSLTKAKTAVAALKGAASDGAASDLPDGGVYVSFSGKTGRYSIGQDKEEENPDEAWLVNVWSYEAGWTCWKGGAPVAKRLGSIFSDPVPAPDMDEHGPFRAGAGEGWAKTKAFMMRSLDNGRQAYFATTSKSGLREFAKVESEVARRMEEALPCWPILQLEKEQFTAQGQKNWKPKLSVLGWLGMPQVLKLAECESASEIAQILPRLVAAAQKMEANGIADTTLGGDEDQVEEDQIQSDDDDQVDDGVEDAEIVDETVDLDNDDAADEVDEEPAPAPVRRAAPASAATGLKKATTGPATKPTAAAGLRRR